MESMCSGNGAAKLDARSTPPSRFRFPFPKLSSFLFPNTKARQTDSLPDACSKIQEEIFLVTSDQVIWDRASPPVAIGLNLVQL